MNKILSIESASFCSPIRRRRHIPQHQTNRSHTRNVCEKTHQQGFRHVMTLLLLTLLAASLMACGEGNKLFRSLNLTVPTTERVRQLGYFAESYHPHQDITASQGNGLQRLSSYKRVIEHKDDMPNRHAINEKHHSRQDAEDHSLRQQLEQIQQHLDAERASKRTLIIVFSVFLSLLAGVIILILYILRRHTQRQHQPQNLCVDQHNGCIEELPGQSSTSFGKYSPGMNRKEEGVAGLSASEREFLNKFVDLATEQIKQHNTDLNALAKAFCITRTQLNRKIKAISGMSSINYIVSIRVNMAKSLLEQEKNMPIKEIAYQCGIEDLPYFTTMFKKTTGMTPKQYRIRTREEISGMGDERRE